MFGAVVTVASDACCGAAGVATELVEGGWAPACGAIKTGCAAAVDMGTVALPWSEFCLEFEDPDGIEPEAPGFAVIGEGLGREAASIGLGTSAGDET